MFGIDINDLQNKVNYATSATSNQNGQNQYQTGSAANPDQTSWMAPVSNSDSTLKQGSTSPASPPSGQTNNTGIAGDTSQVAQTRGQIPAGDGTAISAVNNGWTWGQNNTGVSGYGFGNNPQVDQSGQQQSNGPTFGSFTNTPGWDQTKLNDPNKHDPKYDWLRARQSTGSTGGDLTAAINYYNSHLSNGEQPAKWQGGDKVDFGAGVGPVDVLFGSKGGINSDLWAPINGDSNFTADPSQTNFGAAPGQQNPMQNPMIANRMARFRMMDPAMRQRLMQSNPAIAQTMQQSPSVYGPGANPNNSTMTAPFANNGPINPPMFGNQVQYPYQNPNIPETLFGGAPQFSKMPVPLNPRMYNTIPPNPQPGMSYLT